LFPEVAAPHLRFQLADCQHGVRFAEALQIHTLELPKYNFDVPSLATADRLTQWAFLLDQAGQYEADELRRLLPFPVFHQAIEIMETIAHTPEERQLYESRRKAEMDYRAGLDEALAIGRAEGERAGLEKGRQEGRQQGRDEGRHEGRLQERRVALIEQIQFLQSLLHEPAPSEPELESLDISALQARCAELQQRVRQLG
jgi:flagellar biosynthesis/type III secretory pathway protein FliH